MALQRADAAWAALRASSASPPSASAPSPVPFVTTSASALPPATADDAPLYDVAVCGGTLGVVVAAALAARGVRVAVVERGPLVGREQDWNLSQQELRALVDENVVDDVEALITAEFNPGRCAFFGSESDAVLVRDVLNIGVSPSQVIAAARARLEERGGVVYERTALSGLTVHSDGVELQIASAGAAPLRRLRARMVIDSLGHGSPIAAQARAGAKPDGICLVVGSCARGFPAERNTGGDIIVTCSELEAGCEGSDLRQQLFWEAFPASSGPSDRTTYAFTYVDASEGRPSLTQMLESYWSKLESYQNVKLDDLQLQRVLFGCFPTYRSSPLRLPYDRILAVGDASGIQSPLSFGGFGALCRHLPRYAAAVSGALQVDALDADSLGLINPYFPNLSAAWLFARAMSVPRGTDPNPAFVNRLLSTNFKVMQRLGESTLRPFLQDVPSARGLLSTLLGMVLARPSLVPAILVHLGPAALADWVGHYAAMWGYTLAARAVGPLLRAHGGKLPPRLRWRAQRQLEAWEYGSGLDYAMPTVSHADADRHREN